MSQLYLSCPSNIMAERESVMPSSFRIAFVHPDDTDTPYGVDVDMPLPAADTEGLTEAIIRALPGARLLAAKDHLARISATPVPDDTLRATAAAMLPDMLSFPGTPGRYRVVVYDLDSGFPDDSSLREVDAVDGVHAGFQAVWHSYKDSGADPARLETFLGSMNEYYADDKREVLHPLAQPAASSMTSTGERPATPAAPNPFVSAKSMLRGALDAVLGGGKGDIKGADWRNDWREETVIEAGTRLYKGTTDENVSPGEPAPYTWFTTDRELARMFALIHDHIPWEEGVPMIHEYVAERDIALPLARSERELKSLCKRYGIEIKNPHQASLDAKESGLPGWVAMKCYPGSPGDDILLGDVAALRYERTMDRDWNDLGRIEPRAAPGMGR